PVLRWHIVAIHLISEQHVLERFRKRNAPSELHLSGWSLGFFKRSPICAFQNYFARFGFYFRAIEQGCQRNACPFGRSHSSEAPLHSFHFRLEKIAIVPRAFERHRSRQRL